MLIKVVMVWKPLTTNLQSKYLACKSLVFDIKFPLSMLDKSLNRLLMYSQYDYVPLDHDNGHSDTQIGNEAHLQQSPRIENIYNLKLERVVN